ncbi:hypothetical protein [Bowmanella yangjiangensis]|uniref:Uncharacterized protein n=1 Tax=Bowmanella yangjiangensis TaxID=2811230 RepID=A0ABS3CRQ7_9ALTE|nr:hypothetical protein [Bowmanella yangjiangensis]MBN7819782.1 hypothetical protein [Bowmanella yangjiangensis]
MPSVTAAQLPYKLPATPKQQLQYLAAVVDIPYSLLENGGDAEIQALCYAILYRHLDRYQKIEAMEHIRKLNGPLLTRVMNVALHPTYVNKKWGVWSMTTEELFADKKFHERFAKFASLIGVGASVTSVSDFIRELKKKRQAYPRRNSNACYLGSRLSE